jgi:hypothetical protein
MKRPNIIWLGENKVEKTFVRGLTRKSHTSIAVGDCGGCVEATQNDKNVISSENKIFLNHVTQNPNHVPLFRLAVGVKVT